MSCDLSDPEILIAYNEITSGQDTDWYFIPKTFSLLYHEGGIANASGQFQALCQ